MQKIDVFLAPSRAKRTRDIDVTECGQRFEVGLEELTALDEIAAADLAQEVMATHEGGVRIGDELVEPTARTWTLMCRLHLMQRRECRFYSPEEFLYVFHKLPAVANALFDANMELSAPLDPKEPAPTSDTTS